jgi:hypothetical protein
MAVMRVKLVERKTGQERGWLEFDGPIVRAPAGMLFEEVTTVGAFCGFEPIQPPGQIWIL